MDVYLIIELFLENHCGRTLSGDKETLDVMASAFWDFALIVACEVWLFSYICYATAWKYKQHHWRPWPWGTHFHLLWTPLHSIDLVLSAPLHVFPTPFYFFFSFPSPFTWWTAISKHRDGIWMARHKHHRQNKRRSRILEEITQKNTSPILFFQFLNFNSQHFFLCCPVFSLCSVSWDTLFAF